MNSCSYPRRVKGEYLNSASVSAIAVVTGNSSWVLYQELEAEGEGCWPKDACGDTSTKFSVLSVCSAHREGSAACLPAGCDLQAEGGSKRAVLCDLSGKWPPRYMDVFELLSRRWSCSERVVELSAGRTGLEEVVRCGQAWGFIVWAHFLCFLTAEAM